MLRSVYVLPDLPAVFALREWCVISVNSDRRLLTDVYANLVWVALYIHHIMLYNN